MRFPATIHRGKQGLVLALPIDVIAGKSFDVAISGDTVLVGDPVTGKVFVYEKELNQTWSELAAPPVVDPLRPLPDPTPLIQPTRVLTVSTGVTDGFGVSVALTSNDAGNLQKGSELKLFKPVDARLADRIPTNYRAMDNSWIGVSARARVLVVNKNQKDTDFVKSVFDLADPRLAGKLAITHSGNESYIAGVTVYMQKAGEEKTSAWLAGMKNNINNSVFNKHSKIVKAVADGKKAIGLVNHYYIYRHLEKHPDAPIEIRLPDQGKDDMGVAWNVAGVAVSKYSQKQSAAEKYVDFVTSQEGQQLFARVNREYPTRPGVQAAPEVPAAGSYKIADVPMADLGKYRNKTLDLIEAVGMP